MSALRLPLAACQFGKSQFGKKIVDARQLIARRGDGGFELQRRFALDACSARAYLDARLEAFRSQATACEERPTLERVFQRPDQHCGWRQRRRPKIQVHDCPLGVLGRWRQIFEQEFGLASSPTAKQDERIGQPFVDQGEVGFSEGRAREVPRVLGRPY